MEGTERLRRPEREPERVQEAPAAAGPVPGGFDTLGNQAVSRLARSAAGADPWAGQTVPADIQRQIDAKRGGGQPLPGDVAARMSEHLGDDVSDVRVHTDPTAAELSRTVQAKAFTTGRDVFFAPGEYKPGSSGGDELLAHELTHVVQQRGVSTSGPLRVSTPGDEQERQADALGQGLARAVDDRVLARDLRVGGGSGGGPGQTTTNTPAHDRPATNTPTTAPPVTAPPVTAPPVDQQPAPAEQPAVTPADARMISGLVMGPLSMAMGQLGGTPDVTRAKAALDTVIPAHGALLNIANSKQAVGAREKYDPPLDAVEAAGITLQAIAQADTEAQAGLAGSILDDCLAEIDRVAALPVNNSPTPTAAQQGANSTETGSLTQLQKDQLNGPIRSQIGTLKAKIAGKPWEEWDPSEIQGEESVYTGMLESLGVRELTGAASKIRRAFSVIKVMAQSLDEQWVSARGKLVGAISMSAGLLAQAGSGDATAGGGAAGVAAPGADASASGSAQ